MRTRVNAKVHETMIQQSEPIQYHNKRRYGKTSLVLSGLSCPALVSHSDNVIISQAWKALTVGYRI